MKFGPEMDLKRNCFQGGMIEYLWESWGVKRCQKRGLVFEIETRVMGLIRLPNVLELSILFFGLEIVNWKISMGDLCSPVEPVRLDVVVFLDWERS